MLRRIVRLGLPGLLLVASVAVAKPPEAPVSPLVEGREPPPIVREHYAGISIGATFNEPLATEPASTPAPFENWLEWLKSVVEPDLTIPLGTVDVTGGE